MCELGNDADWVSVPLEPEEALRGLLGVDPSDVPPEPGTIYHVHNWTTGEDQIHETFADALAGLDGSIHDGEDWTIVKVTPGVGAKQSVAEGCGPR